MYGLLKPDMESVSISRHVDAAPERVRAAIADLGPFMQAAGFDSVELDGDTVHVANDVGITTIELTLELVDDEAHDLVYEQQDGIFESMRTTYSVTRCERKPTASAVGLSDTPTPHPTARPLGRDSNAGI